MNQQSPSSMTVDDAHAQFAASVAAIRQKMVAAFDLALTEYDEAVWQHQLGLRASGVLRPAAGVGSSMLPIVTPTQQAGKSRRFGDGSKRTSREIALSVLASSPGPVDWQSVREAIEAEGLTKFASDKIRETAKKTGLIELKDGLYSLTPSGRQQHERFKSASNQDQ